MKQVKYIWNKFLSYMIVVPVPLLVLVPVPEMVLIPEPVRVPVRVLVQASEQALVLQLLKEPERLEAKAANWTRVSGEKEERERDVQQKRNCIVKIRPDQFKLILYRYFFFGKSGNLKIRFL